MWLIYKIDDNKIGLDGYSALKFSDWKHVKLMGLQCPIKQIYQLFNIFN